MLRKPLKTTDFKDTLLSKRMSIKGMSNPSIEESVIN